MRLIDANDFERRIMATLTEEEICDDCLREFLSCMDTQPTVDAEPVKHGKWKGLEHTGGNLSMCTCCEKYWIVTEDKYDFNYCPSCGAKMDLGDE